MNSIEDKEFKEALKKTEKSLKRRLKSLSNSIKRNEARLNEAHLWEKERQNADLLKANLSKLFRGLKEVTLENFFEEGDKITLPLDPEKSPQEELASRYKKAKKQKASIPYLEKEIQKGMERKEALIVAQGKLLEAKRIEDLDAIEKTLLIKRPSEKREEKKGKEVKKPYLEYLSSSNVKIFVGKNAKDNERLTFQHAKGNDTWLHVTSYPGSHVVIHSNTNPDEKTLMEAMQLALYYSRARELGEAEISITLVKFVKRLGKKAGTVQLAKESRRFCRLNKALIPHLL